MLCNSLKDHLVRKFGIKAPATDGEFSKLLGEKLASGELTPADLIKNSTANSLANYIRQRFGLSDAATPREIATVVHEKLASGELTIDDLQANSAIDFSKDGTTMTAANTNPNKLASPTDAFGSVRVIPASEGYSTTKSVARHVKTGATMKHHGRDVDSPSQLDYAKLGAYIKWRASRSRVGGDVILRDHEKQLVEEMIHKDAWCGDLAGTYHTDLRDSDLIKQGLLSDSGSGGQSLNPIWFDDQTVTFPLLYGEIFPDVDLVEMPRGNQVQLGGVNNVTVTWGVGEGSPITEIDATGLVQNLNSSVFDVKAAIEVGRDLLMDSPVKIGETVAKIMAPALASQLDYVIAAGDGATQPQGILNVSGLTQIATVCGESGPFTCGDIESLMRACPKQYRIPALRCRFISNDTTYWRVRAIPQGERDARRLFGMDHNDYTVFATPWKIQQNIADGTAIFGPMARYRMYRRLGQEMRWSDQGVTLMTRDTMLLTLKGRYAGRCLGSAGFVSFTGGATADLG